MCSSDLISLEEIRQLLDYRDEPRRDCTWVTELIGTRITAVDKQIQSFVRLKKYLEELRGKCSGGGSAGGCGIMRSLGDMALCSCSGGKKGPAQSCREPQGKKKNVLIYGRVNPNTMAYINSNAKCHLRILSEKRNMKALEVADRKSVV